MGGLRCQEEMEITMLSGEDNRLRTSPAPGEDQTGKKFFTNSCPDKQKDLILKAFYTAPDQTNLFQTSSSLDIFMYPSTPARPCPDSYVLKAIDAHPWFLLDMSSGLFLLLQTVKIQ